MKRSNIFHGIAISFLVLLAACSPNQEQEVSEDNIQPPVAEKIPETLEANGDNNKLLLYSNMDVGHGGASGRFERYKLTALQYAFMFNLIGITE